MPTILGVPLTWVVLINAKAPIVLSGLICLFATGAVLARTRNYLAYSALSTPVILIVLDFDEPIRTALLVDRLTATLAGADIVAVLNLVFDRLIKAVEAMAS